MKIIRIKGRHFVVRHAGEAQDVALKVLNEMRNLGELDGLTTGQRKVVERALDEVDGEFAFQLLPQIEKDIELIVPEAVR